MPKETFFHLPEEKRKRILQAAQVEFSRTSLQEASIAKIIKLAEIPRGSFYQYFENKEDLYFYYLEMLRFKSTQDLQREIARAQGDLLVGIEVYFTQLVSDIFIGKDADFYKHLFMHLDMRVSHQMTEAFAQRKQNHRLQKKEYLLTLYQLVDTEKLAIHSPEELHVLMTLLMNTVFFTISENYRRLCAEKEVDVDAVLHAFHQKMHWIKYGVYRGKKDIDD